MTIVDMHFDFKQKMNKVDSQNFINYRIPEIDRFLNEAQVLFVKNVIFPRKMQSNLVDMSQRYIDDIRTIVKTRQNIPVINNKADIPDDYMFFVKGTAVARKNGHDNTLRLLKRKHNDRFDSNNFYNSSYEWREAVCYFQGDSIELFTDNSFDYSKIDLTYVKHPGYMHNAGGIVGGNGYALGDGTTLTGRADCELPSHVHSEIVDLAVVIAKGATHDNGYEASINKLKIDNLT